MESRNMAVIFPSIKNDLAKIIYKSIDIFAKEAKVDDEGKRAAETLAVFQGSIGTGVHHELLGELGLGEFFALASLSKAVGQIGAEGAFTGVLHGGDLAFVNIRMKRTLSIAKG